MTQSMITVDLEGVEEVAAAEGAVGLEGAVKSVKMVISSAGSNQRTKTTERNNLSTDLKS